MAGKDPLAARAVAGRIEFKCAYRILLTRRFSLDFKDQCASALASPALAVVARYDSETEAAARPSLIALRALHSDVALGRALAAKE